MPKRAHIVTYLKQLRESIIQAFEDIEEEGKFLRQAWNYNKGEGGGEIAQLRGKIFEKGAVNFSAVSGDTFPLDETKGPFFATGVSLITHMTNPFMPTVHFNIRYIELGDRFWFGGGYDLTPMGFPHVEDTAHFHNTAKEALDSIDPSLYPQFSQQAKDYFYIPHLKRERGVGGLFFDYYDNYAVWKAVGESFLPSIIPIYQKKKSLPYTPLDREKQAYHRAAYVEFNLLYDRGTKFGFASGGNPDAILCSLPPTAKW